jgi:CHAT domain
MEEAKRFGVQLFDALLRDQVRQAYFTARQAADIRQRGLRLTLQLTHVPELMEIPWEFLHDSRRFLSHSIYTPVVRSLDLQAVRPPTELTLPLRVLGVVSSPTGLATLDVAAERHKLESALASLTANGIAELMWLGKATMSELDRVVGAPDEIHVIHYIGHGAYDKRTQGGLLVMEDAHGNPHEVTGEELASFLYDERSIALAVLNACEGARTSHVDPFSGVASSLVQCGIPAVIGMQFEVTDQAAVVFAERIYSALVQGFPVDAALAQARRAIMAAGNDVEFGTPVLFLRSGATRLFEIKTPRPVGAVLVPEPERDERPGDRGSESLGQVATHEEEHRGREELERKETPRKVRFLTEGWARLVTEAINADAGVVRAMSGVRLTAQIYITGGPQGDVAYSIHIDDGRGTISLGEAPNPDIVVSSPYEDAVRDATRTTGETVMRSIWAKDESGGAVKKGSWKLLRYMPLFIKMQRVDLAVAPQVEF